MLFNSFAFLVFLPAVLGLDRLLRRWAVPRKLFLLAASYFFYGCWDWRFLGLILLSTGVDWFAGNGIAATEDPRRRRRWLLMSLCANLGVLGTFKYLDFFLGSANRLLEGLGLEGPFPVLHLILPVGISFYTFQTLSYTIDIYRRKLRPAGSFLDFALFVAFFPQLVAGPIVRARDFLPQLRDNVRPTDYSVGWGLYQVLSGLFKKVVIADYLGQRLVEPLHGDPSVFGVYGALAGIYGYAFQIYGDFAGYSQIAIGVGRLLGFRLPVNFRSPYLARDMSDFWRRWHVSLSTWLRDYLYIPLGGNRGGRGFVYRNLMITMLLGGLWHGAGWNFVIWGCLHGTALIVSHTLAQRRQRLGITRSDSWAAVWRQRLVVFHVWALSMVFFRAQSLDGAMQVFGALGRWSGERPPSAGLAMLVLAGVVHVLGETWNPKAERGFLRLPPEIRGVLTAILLGLFSLMAASEAPFIYFQF